MNRKQVLAQYCIVKLKSFTDYILEINGKPRQPRKKPQVFALEYLPVLPVESKTW